MDILFYSSLFILLILIYVVYNLMSLLDRNYEIYKEYISIIEELREGVTCDNIPKEDLHNINVGIKIAANIIEARLNDEIVELNKLISQEIE